MKNSQLSTLYLLIFLLFTSAPQAIGMENGMHEALNLIQSRKPSLLEDTTQPTIRTMIEKLPDDKRLAATIFYIENFPHNCGAAREVLPVFQRVDPAQADAYLREAKDLQATYSDEEYREDDRALAEWFQVATHSLPEQFSLVRKELDFFRATYSLEHYLPSGLYQKVATAERAGINSITKFTQSYRSFLTSYQLTINLDLLEKMLREYPELTSLPDLDYKLKFSLGLIGKGLHEREGKQKISHFELQALIVYRQLNPEVSSVGENAFFEICKQLVICSPKQYRLPSGG